MRTYSLLKDIPVYTDKGSLVGEVCDICIAKDGNVKSLLVKGKGLFNKLYSLPIDQVKTYGQNAIVIQESTPLAKYKEAEDEHTMCHFRPISKAYAISGCGEELGLLEDVYFHEEVGTIIGYELTDGFFSDLKEGRRVIHSVHPPKFGKDAIIVNVNQLRGGERTYDEVPELPK
ncbi:PRC-barrel domain-containing protein [Bacillus sp. FJAT-49736]|uniref:PRC-barrel domain-containing protein n=1 Tax=Bacillus sp. FJAT-49736 TaxID=2833582 RepID=UPI001BC9F425|nr:PRC-barrel domain-containing protein [Bacillus sp. FJAT-49736]MBS4173642.1 PRC-barrel domain-containing protein [Bacillus sp. FJAT-49736]